MIDPNQGKRKKGQFYPWTILNGTMLTYFELLQNVTVTKIDLFRIIQGYFWSFLFANSTLFFFLSIFLTFIDDLAFIIYIHYIAFQLLLSQQMESDTSPSLSSMTCFQHVGIILANLSIWKNLRQLLSLLQADESKKIKWINTSNHS